MEFANITFHSMGTENGGSNPVFSPGFDVSGFRYMTTILVVRDAGGTTPQLTVTLEHSMDGETWLTLDAFAAVTGANSLDLASSDPARFVRARFVYAGTNPWFTFSLMAIARG
jgi:hypothetical protein